MTLDQWLIRTADNWIAGPYTKEQVCEMIQDKKLSLKDEICPGNGYWFYLSEQAEVRKHLDIEMTAEVSRPDEEITQNGLEAGEATDPAMPRQPESGSIMRTRKRKAGAATHTAHPFGQASISPQLPASSEDLLSWKGLIWVGAGIGIVVAIFVMAHFLAT